MKLINPTDKDIVVVFKGEELSVLSQGITKELSVDQVEFWLRIHPFLTIQKIEEKKVITEEKVAKETKKK